MSPFQSAFERLRKVADHRDAVILAVDAQLARPELTGEHRSRMQSARADVDLTYLRGLLPEFEGVLTELGPHLASSIEFQPDDGLAVKVSAIAKRMGMERAFRKVVEEDILLARNHLLHGSRRPIPVDLDGTYMQMKVFLRNCR